MTSHTRPIGVFDSGIGGLTVLKHLTKVMPDEHFIYLGDTARVPYGNRSADTVRTYAQECARFLAHHNVKMMVVACNTVSAVALDTIEHYLTTLGGTHNRTSVIGVIDPAARAAVSTSVSGRIGVIGTRATIASDAYAIAMRRISNGKELSIHSRACPLFVPLVEEGWTDTRATRLIAEEYLRPLIAQEIDTLVLGCTHYPVLTPLLNELMPNVALVDCGACTAVEAAHIVDAQQSEGLHRTNIDLYVTDITPAFGMLARQFLGMPVDDPVRVTLDPAHFETSL
ncbi:MAG: glutamate racemase [Ignavibacteria bacterium]|nr:glutamate racemase [Ignavibacteria bacterium]